MAFYSDRSHAVHKPVFLVPAHKSLESLILFLQPFSFTSIGIPSCLEAFVHRKTLVSISKTTHYSELRLCALISTEALQFISIFWTRTPTVVASRSKDPEKVLISVVGAESHMNVGKEEISNALFNKQLFSFIYAWMKKTWARENK